MIGEAPEWKVPDTEQLGFVTETGQYRVIHDPKIHTMEVGQTMMASTGQKFTLTTRESEHAWEKTVNDSSDANSKIATTVIERTSAYLPAISHKDTVQKVEEMGTTGWYYESIYPPEMEKIYYIFTDGKSWVLADKATVETIRMMHKKGMESHKGVSGDYKFQRHPASHGYIFIREQLTPGDQKYAIIAEPMRRIPGAPKSAQYTITLPGDFSDKPEDKQNVSPNVDLAQASTGAIFDKKTTPDEDANNAAHFQVSKTSGSNGESKVRSIEFFQTWINKGIEREATFIAIDTPSGMKHSDNENIFSDIYSITKSVFGLLVARAHMKYHDKRQKMKRFNVLDSASSMMSKINDNPNDPINWVAGLVCGATLNDLLTQVSGVKTKEVAYSDILPLKNGVDLIDWTKTKIVAMRETQYRDDPDYKPPPFKYDNIMTQVAEFAYAFRMRQILSSPTFTTKEEGMDTIFRKFYNAIYWPEGVTASPLLHSTMVFMGIKLTGIHLYELGRYLVNDKEWFEVLEFIHKWDHASRIPTTGYETRQGWRYSFLWWIPDEKAFDGMRYVVAIGLFGQYLVINLDKKAVAVRQHELSSEDIIRLFRTEDFKDEHPEFVQDVHQVFKREFEKA